MMSKIDVADRERGALVLGRAASVERRFPNRSRKSPRPWVGLERTGRPLLGECSDPRGLDLVRGLGEPMRGEITGYR